MFDLPEAMCGTLSCPLSAWTAPVSLDEVSSLGLVLHVSLSLPWGLGLSQAWRLMGTEVTGQRGSRTWWRPVLRE